MTGKSKWVVVAAMLIGGVTVYADAYNFSAQSIKKGCESIITEAGQNQCKSVQAAKNAACSQSVRCDVDAQERLIEKYKQAKEQLDRGEINDADKDQLKERIATLKDTLDANREQAHRGISIAESCVSARKDVQKWFADTGIPLTEQTRDAALAERQRLLDALATAQQRQADAKAKREANPDDKSAQDEYEAATEAMRDAEKALEAFNDKYGKDIAYYAGKLVDQYNAERASHDTPLAEAQNRADNCHKVDDMTY